MHCGNCASSVANALKATNGVDDVQVSFEKGEAVGNYDEQKVTIEKLREVFTNKGYKVAGETLMN